MLALALGKVLYTGTNLPYISERDYDTPMGMVTLLLFVYAILVLFLGDDNILIFFGLGEVPFFLFGVINGFLGLMIAFKLRSKFKSQYLLVALVVACLSGMLKAAELIQSREDPSGQIFLYRTLFWLFAIFGTVLGSMVLYPEMNNFKSSSRSTGVRWKDFGSGIGFGAIVGLPGAVLALFSYLIIGNLDRYAWINNGWEFIYGINTAFGQMAINALLLLPAVFVLLYGFYPTSNAQSIAVLYVALLNQFATVSTEILFVNVSGYFINLLFYVLPPIMLLIKKNLESVFGFYVSLELVRYIVFILLL